MSSTLIVKTAYANIYSEPKFSSQLVTQALFFETLKVISSNGDWLEVSQWDGYKGYVHSFYLSDNLISQRNDFVVKDRFLSLYDSPDFSNLIMMAPFGARIPIIFNNDEYYMSESINDKTYFFREEISSSNDDIRSMIIKYSKKLIGSPYLWGGKTPFGYDCSGFVQQVFKSLDISFQRDTSEQIKDNRMSSIDIESVNKGDILFFDMEGNGVDHVGIWYNKNHVIHCGGEVKIQSINDDSHKELREHIIDIKSIGNFLHEQ